MVLMKEIQKEVSKILKENKIELTKEEVLLGIYDQLSQLTRGAIGKEAIRSADLGELGALVLELCNQEGIDFEEAVAKYLKELA